MSEITITHDHASGTLAEGTEKGDGANVILKAAGFRWGRSIGCYYVPKSRDRAARRVSLNAAAEQLREAGHTVSVEINDDPRDNAEVSEDNHKRLEDRRTALAAKGEKLTAQAAALRRASDAMVEHLPLGQPVAPGRKGQAHRRLLDRSVDTAIRSALTHEAAERIPSRIEGSRRAEAYKERPDVTARRVKRMEAEVSRLDRQMAGLGLSPETASSTLREQYEGERAVLLKRLEGDRAVLEEAKAAGTFGRYSKDNVHKDDRVHIRGQWRLVARASAKSVSVTTGYSWTDRYGWEEVRALRCDHVTEEPDAEPSA